MATSPGERFVRRHNAARSSTSNTTAADIGYDTAVLSEGGYSWTSPEVTVDEAGLYLTIFDIGQVDLASTRSVGTLVPSINTTDQTRFRATHRYLRNSGGAQEGASIGMAILNLSANDDVKIRNPGSLTPTDAVGNYATNSTMGGGLQLIRLPAENFTHVERTVDAAEVGTSNINTTRPWIDSSGTWTTITYNSEVQDDDGLYSGSGGDLTLAANKKYMIVWGATCYSTDASRHTYVTRLRINNVNVQTGSGYQRNTASQGTPMCGMYLHETGGTSETLNLQETHETEGGDAGTPLVSDAYVQVLELPADAEWIHVDNGSTDSLTTSLAGLTTWYDTPLSSTFRADGDSNLSLDSVNNAVQNDSGASLPVLAIGWHRWDRDSGTSGTRKNPWTRWDNGGSAVGYGIAGAYSRGQQSADDTFQAHYCSAATLDLANGADLSFQAQDEASGANSDMGVYASANRHFLGVQVLNLDTLQASSDTNVNVGTDTATATTYQASVSLDANVSVGLDTLTATTFPASITLDRNVAAGLDTVTATTFPASVSLDVEVNVATESLTATTNQATVTLGVDVQVGTESATATTYPADITLDVNVDSGVEALTATTYPATISLDIDVPVGTEALTTTTYPADVTLGVNIQVGVESLTATTFPATITLDVNVNAGTVALSETTYPATISSDNVVDVGTVSLTATTYQATVSLDNDIQVGSIGLTETLYPATVSLDRNIQVSTIGLSETLFPVTITIQGDTGIDVGLISLSAVTHPATIEYQVAIFSQPVVSGIVSQETISGIEAQVVTPIPSPGLSGGITSQET